MFFALTNGGFININDISEVNPYSKDDGENLGGFIIKTNSHKVELSKSEFWRLCEILRDMVKISMEEFHEKLKLYKLIPTDEQK